MFVHTDHLSSLQLELEWMLMGGELLHEQVEERELQMGPQNHLR